MTAPLLLEIGCEEIPARMIPDAAAALAARVEEILDAAGLSRGPTQAWGGTRRLAVRVQDVPGRQQDREEVVLGPPAKAAFAPDGTPTPAAAGFARKQGVDPALLQRMDTERGVYAGFRREVPGRDLAEVLQAALPRAVEGMSFPKTMRWAEGKHRWVRPVHWLLALHGDVPLSLALFGVEASSASRGHRFLAPGPVPVVDAGAYLGALQGARVLADGAERRRRLAGLLEAAATAEGGSLVTDAALLDEVADLVEWPGVVTGRFDPGFLDLPREILVTTLRHHQKAFSVQSGGGLLPVFLAVANTDRDPAGHVRRGNEWVVSGRLEDARFFWRADTAQPLARKRAELERVVFHETSGSYADKAERVRAIGASLLDGLRAAGTRVADPDDWRAAASLAKCDLVTSLVGEFPELQGVVGGLLLEAEGTSPAVAAAVREQYRPGGAADGIPATPLGCLLSLADRLDTIHALVRAGERPSGSKDPFALRRAANGAFRILLEAAWPLPLGRVTAAAGEDAATRTFLEERLALFLADRGFSANEVRAVLHAGGGTQAARSSMADIEARLRAVRQQWESDELVRLGELTKRVVRIGPQAEAMVRDWGDPVPSPAFQDPAPAGRELARRVDEVSAAVPELARCGDYAQVIALLSSLAGPVARFFDDVLVLDPGDRQATCHRAALLDRLRALLTSSFDLTQLGGDAAGTT